MQFLDAQRIHNLVNYLQELHSHNLANTEHTTLLLNCYTKLKDVARLDQFIKVGNLIHARMNIYLKLIINLFMLYIHTYYMVRRIINLHSIWKPLSKFVDKLVIMNMLFLWGKERFFL